MYPNLWIVRFAKLDVSGNFQLIRRMWQVGDAKEMGGVVKNMSKIQAQDFGGGGGVVVCARLNT